MENTSVAELVEEFRAASWRIRKFHRNHGGETDHHPHTIAAYFNNAQRLYDAETALRNRGLGTFPVYLRLAHELGVAVALERHPRQLRDQHLHEIRRLVNRYVKAFAAVPSEASDQSHDDVPPAPPGLMAGDG